MSEKRVKCPILIFNTRLNVGFMNILARTWIGQISMYGPYEIEYVEIMNYDNNYFSPHTNTQQEGVASMG